MARAFVPAAIGLLLLAGIAAASDGAPGAPPASTLQSRMEARDYPGAEAAAREALARLEAEGRGESLEAAETLDVLLEARWRQGKATEPETREVGERALALKTRLLPQPSAGIGKTQHHLAIVSFFGGDYAGARSLWERAIANRRGELGPDHPDVAESLNGLANLEQIQADFDAARPLYESALRIYAASYGEDDPRVGRTLNNLGVLLREIGDFAAALPYAERSLAIKRASFDENSAEVAVGLSTLGEIYYETGDLDRALDSYRRALAILESTLGPEHVDVGAALNNLGHLELRRGEHDRAIALFERALEIWEAASGPDHPDVALALNGLASTYEAKGELGRARELQSRGVAIREKALGADHIDVASSLDNLADIDARLGDDARAGAEFERSVAIRRANFGDDHPLVAESLIGLGLTRARSGDSAAALRDAVESERIARDHLRLTGRSLAEEHALRYAAHRNSGLNLALTLAMERPERTPAREVLDAVVRSRAVVLDEIAARNRTVLRSEDPEIADLASRFAAARERLANLIVRGPGRFDIETYNGFVAEARDRKERIERELGAASAAFAREQQLRDPHLAELAATLPPDSALVSYVLYDHLDLAPAPPAAEGDARPAPRSTAPVPSYAALVLRADGAEPVAVRLGPAGEIETRIARWKEEAARGARSVRRDPEASEQAYRAAASDLADAIWGPVAGGLERLERVFVVPDGAINLVSFAALPSGTGTAGTYLVESGPTLHYLSAERDLIPRDAAGTGRGLLALGGPDYDAGGNPIPASGNGPGETSGTRGSACESFDSLRFAPLPAASAESEEIVSRWRAVRSDESATRLTGAAATEAAFKRAAAGRRVLHIATHGFFLGGECATGAEGSRGFKIATVGTPEPVLTTPVSPLLLSGLALAGANRRGEAVAGAEDGVVTAEEIAGLDLSGVEWAVLSACDTGVGEVQAGEGVFGLRRAMQVAGVRTLIMSLWPVDDEATRRWMTALYDGRLAGGLDTATAVREAALDVLRSRRAAGESAHPFYWAAFVAAGDWR